MNQTLIQTGVFNMALKHKKLHIKYTRFWQFLHLYPLRGLFLVICKTNQLRNRSKQASKTRG